MSPQSPPLSPLDDGFKHVRTLVVHDYFRSLSDGAKATLNWKGINWSLRHSETAQVLETFGDPTLAASFPRDTDKFKAIADILRCNSQGELTALLDPRGPPTQQDFDQLFGPPGGNMPHRANSAPRPRAPSDRRDLREPGDVFSTHPSAIEPYSHWPAEPRRSHQPYTEPRERLAGRPGPHGIQSEEEFDPVFGSRPLH